MRAMPQGLIAIRERELPQFRRRLLAWFRRSKRDLDWRRTRDPYRIWVSEIMLQQTRVAAVIPYYRRFLARFPTVLVLARARQDAVLRAWAGLGYYSRARNLRLAAREIVARHGGKFPRQLDAALALPGIGSYTAAAVLSIAYDEPHAALDVNVARVISRLTGVTDARKSAASGAFRHDAERLVARNAPGDWNQAMMELGATVCTPRAPRCDACPVARWCRARALGIARELPAGNGNRAKRITLAAAVLLDPRGRTLMVRQSDGALFSRLWQFPAVRAVRESGSREALARHVASALGLRDVPLVPLATARHSVTDHDIRLVPFLVRLDSLPTVAGARMPRLAALDRLPVSSATRKIAAAAITELS
jgi:A/G-specific adenine glycosylase